MVIRVISLIVASLSVQVSGTVLDTRLQPGAVRILKEVETLFGRPLAAERVALPSGVWAVARVDPDGTPRIRITPEASGDAAIIVHELLHLRLLARGAPLFLWKSRASEELLRALGEVHSQIYDSIQHRSFGVDMRILGLDPSVRLKEQLRQILRQRAFGGRSTALGRAVLAARVFLEFGEGSELEALRGWYAEAGWNDSLASGNRAIAILTPVRSEPRAQAEQSVATLRALGIDVRIEGYDEVMLGKHRRVRALAFLNAQ